MPEHQQWLIEEESTTIMEEKKPADVFSPELTPREFEALCLEQASLRRRDEAIIAQLRHAVKNGRAGKEIIREHRAGQRQQRKAAREELEQERKDHRAEMLGRLSPEARATLQARIAGLKEYTKEELHEETRLAQAKAKENRAASRRWKNGNGSVA